MTVLQKIDYILIKSRYHAYPSDVRYISSVLLDCLSVYLHSVSFCYFLYRDTQ